ncbi:hypothetical protein HOY82DRAFT_625310 [Tuber indicum]|nr:hypothetical protein HOY82DRAFT_625310 [Tuber indicum]
MGEMKQRYLRAHRATDAGIGRDILLAGEAGTNTNDIRATIQPGTLYVYHNAQALWADIIGAVDDLSRGGPLPSPERIMGWIRWIAYTSSGRRQIRPLRSTVLTYWSRLREAVTRETNQQFPFVTGNLALPGMPPLVLPIEHHEKPIFDVKDLKLALLFQILVFSGCRPGSITESNCHRNSNEVPVYKDFELSLVKDNGGKVVLMLAMTIRYMKGRRGKEILFHEDLKEFGLGLCPVTLFLALAFADNGSNLI